MEKITPLITDTVDFIVNTLPKIQYWISGGAIVIGLCLLMMGYLRLRNNEAIEEESKKTKEENNWKKSLVGLRFEKRCWTRSRYRVT